MLRKKMTEASVALDNEITPEMQERHRATLLRNNLVGNKLEIVERILNSARFSKFLKGKKIIEQGANDDCVYFIISGSVEVRIDGRHVDYKSAPCTVGEMAASKPGECRTADVSVNSQVLETVILSGTEFRKLMADFPDFATNLGNLVDALAREKMAQLGKVADSKGLSWVSISTIAAVIVGLVLVITCRLLSLTILPTVLVSLGSSVVLFIAMQIINPELGYRNMFRASGYGVIALALYGSSSFVLTVNGDNKGLPFFLDFSTAAESKALGLALPFLALLALAWLSAHYDHKLRQSKQG